MPGLKLIAVCVVITTAAIITGNPTNSISEECMTCLCEGATGCNMTAGCQSTYPGALFCGPFHISWQYWLDAGSPTLHDAEERRPSREIFQECTLDYDCAATTVENYVHKFVISLERDCDGDGLVNCADYAKVHKRGGYACNQTDDRPYKVLW